MIYAHFFKSGKLCSGFSISGHAGYADYGKDIACASVTSAVELTADGITEILGLPAELNLQENEIRLLFDQRIGYDCCSALFRRFTAAFEAAFGGI